MKFYRNEQIEQIAEEKLLALTQITGKPLAPPIPIELLAEKVMELHIDWDTIEEKPGEVILGGLMLADKPTIIMNDTHKTLLTNKPGIERFTLGHEMGHWELFVDKRSAGHPILPGVANSDFFMRRSSGKGIVEVMQSLIKTEDGQEVVAELHARMDKRDEARVVNRFAAAILMPRDLVLADVRKFNRTQWPNLYDMARRFEVSIGALCVRLQQLGLIYIKGKQIFESKDEALGQGTLGLG